MFALSWVAFFVAAIFSFIIQYRLVRSQFTPWAFFKHCFPLAIWKDKSSHIDVVIHVVSRLIKRFMHVGHMVMVVAIASVVGAALKIIAPTFVAMEINFAVVIGFSIVAAIAWDFSIFISHYMQHKIPFLWELHKVHHSATVLTPFTATRHHPLAEKLDMFVGAFIVGTLFGLGQFFYGFTVVDMAILLGNVSMIVTLMVMDSLRHSHFAVGFGWFEKILISPRMHQLHHSAKVEHWDKNIGFVLTIWDRLFGTLHMPVKGEALTYGIGRGPEMDASFKTIPGVYIAPAVNMTKVLLGISPPDPAPDGDMALPVATAAEPVAEVPLKGAVVARMPALSIDVGDRVVGKLAHSMSRRSAET